MAGLLITLFCLLVFLPQRNAQITCYTEPSVAGEFNCLAFTNNFQASTIEECCVEHNGYFFEGGGNEFCQACIVLGFFNGSEISLPEQGEATILAVGFIKGGNVQPLTGLDRRNTARFAISITGSATEGPNADFTIQPTSFEIKGPDARVPFDLTAFIRIDGVALEPTEDFILTLEGRNNAGRAIISPTLPGQFVVPAIRVVIEDVENATLQFTESDYSNPEGELLIVPVVQVLTSIATDLIVRIVPLNITQALARELPSSFPTIPPFDPRVPNIATTVADFSTTPQEITFVAGGATTIPLNPGIAIVDDDINEVEQIFALFLEVVDAIDPVRVDLQSERFASLGRIFDDDPINVGFEQERYTVFEAFDATGQQIPIPIIKENGQESEITFEVITTLTLGSGPRAAQPGEDFEANPPVQRQDFDVDEQVISYRFELFNDTAHNPGVPEPTETFQIQLSLADEGLTNINLGASGGSLFATATIVIIDDDDVIIGWEQNITNVNESQSILELCVRVLNLADAIEFPEGFEVSLAANTIRGTAADPEDYTALQADSDIFFDIIDDDTRRTCIEVEIIDNDLLEGVEFFSIEVVPDPFVTDFPTNVQLDPSLIFVEISDFVQIGFNPTEYVVLEGDGVATVYVVVLQGDLQRSVSVTFSTIPGTATTISDFQQQSRMLMFEKNVHTIAVSIAIVTDTLTELEESFSVSLTQDPLDSPSDVVIDPDEATVRILDDDAVTIGFEQTLYTVTEGVHASVELCAIVREAALAREAIVTFLTMPGSATSESPADYQGPSMDLTFGPGITRRCVDVTVVEDDIMESTENFFGSLTTTDTVLTLDPDVAEVVISEDSSDSVVIGFERTMYNVTERVDASVELCAVLTTGVLEREAVVRFSASDGTATSRAPTDYAGTIEDLTFDGSTNRNCVIVAITDDDILEDTENFFGTLTTTDSSVTLSPDRAQVNIFEDPDDGVTIGFERTVYTATEGVDASVELCAVLTSGTLEREAVVTFSTSDGTATSLAPADYDETIADLTFDGSTDRNCVNVPIVNDDALEATESFSASLTTSDLAVTLNPDLARVDIFEDPNDSVTIGFERTMYNVTEGVDASVELCAVLTSGILEREAVVEFSTSDGTATSGAPIDYAGTTEDLTFDGSTDRNCVIVAITDDDILEDTENFFGTLTTTDSSVTLSPDRAQVNIFEDPDDGVTIGLERMVYNATAGVDASVELCAVLITGILERQTTVMFSTSDGTATAIAPADYNETFQDLTFDGSTNRNCVAVPIANDDALEATESFTASLTTSDPAVTLNPDLARVDIFEDHNDGVIIGFERTVYDVTEGLDATVELCAVLTSGTPEREAVVRFSTSDGTATYGAPTDFAGIIEDLTFDGSTVRNCVTVAITDDDILEDTEKTFGTLTTTDSRVTLSPDRAQVNIFEDPNDGVTIGFERTVYNVTEGIDASVELCAVLIMGELERQAIVTFSTADDTATSTAPADFGGAIVNWGFDDSTARNCINVSIENDNILEDTERFFGSLTTTDGAVTLNPDQAQVNIFEDSNDGVTIGFEQALYVAPEGVNPSVELCAIITMGTLQREAVVRFSTMDGTATSTDPVDYVAVSVDFTFDPGNSRCCVDVSIMDDDILEATKHFFGDLTTTDPAVTLNPDRAQVDINEDPNDGVTIGFEETLYMAIEGLDLEVQLCAVLTMGVLEREAVIMFFTADSTAESAAPDYTATIVDFTFGPGISRQCVNVSIEDDIPLEDTEFFFGNLATTDAGVTLSPQTAQVDIIDAGMVVIGFEQTLYTATEGVDPVVELCATVLMGILSRDAVVEFTIVDGTATSTPPRDYMGTTTNLLFNDDVTRQCVNVSIVNDDILENTENFFASVTTTVQNVFINPARAEVEIREDPTDGVTIGFERTIYSVTEGVDANVELCAVLTIGLLERGAVVMFSTSDGTATSTAPVDYGETTADFTFDPDSSKHCVDVPIENDGILEDTENVFGSLATTDSAVNLNPDRAQVDINKDTNDGVTIGFERTVYNVTEGVHASVKLCAMLITGTLEREAVVMFLTSDGTATSTAPTDYDETDLDFVFGGDNSIRCVNVSIIDDDILEDTESFYGTLTTADSAVLLNPDRAEVLIIKDPNDVSTCMAEETVVTNEVHEDERITNSLYWPETQIGQTVFVNCTCGNVTIARASRFCGGDIVTGATWENPDDSACTFTNTVKDICQLVTADQEADTGTILEVINELTEENDKIGVAGISVTTFILENLSSNITEDQNRTMIESFLTVVDHLLAVDPAELQESQQEFNTSARLLKATQTVTDALSIPENESHAVIALTFFAVAVQEIQADFLQPHTFSALFGRTSDGAINSKELLFDVHQNSTASITLPASALRVEPLSANMTTNTRIRIANSVYVNDLLFLRREEESQKVGSIVISASVSSNNRSENLDPPVRLTFKKNANVENGTNTTCSFWDPTADNGFGDWSTHGCAVVNETEESVVCECDHLTNFAILLDVSPKSNGTSISVEITKTLEALSYIGAIISICFLTLTIATYLSSKKLRSSEPSQLLVHLCFGFLGIYIVYVFALHATAVSGLCVLAGVMVHYFLLATFFIMAADAILIFNKLIFVFVKIRRYVAIASIISWSVPAIIAIATVAPDYKNYLEINFCRPYGIQFYAGLLAPFLAIYIFNWIVYVIIMVFLINHYFCKSKDTVKKLHQGSQVRQQFRNAIALSLLFGLGWAFGLPATEGIDSVSVRTAFQVLFIIVTAFQGLYIFIMQCLTGSNAVDARKEWQRWLYFITCRPGHVHAYTLSRTLASASDRKGKFSKQIETSTLTSSKASPSVAEGKLDYATVLEIDTRLEEKSREDTAPCQHSTLKSFSKTEESEQLPKISINIPADACNQTDGSSGMLSNDN